ncbi:MAG: hypothetical protein ACLTLQ_08775 [[Clostridium] scindens]
MAERNVVKAANSEAEKKCRMSRRYAESACGAYQRDSLYRMRGGSKAQDRIVKYQSTDYETVLIKT